jgi:hypothetical protein
MPEEFKIFGSFMFKLMATDPIYLPDGNVILEAALCSIILGNLLKNGDVMNESIY